MTTPPASLSHVLETCLYVKDIKIATDFYQNKLRLDPFFSTERMSVFPLGNTVLILFTIGQTASDSQVEGGLIPGHGPSQSVIEVLRSDDSTLKQHFCLAAETPDQVRSWETWLADQNVNILSTMDWEKGGRSVYFTDPDGHVGEIGSRGIWPHY